MTGAVTVVPVTGIGEVTTGSDLGRILLDALRAQGLTLVDGDVLVVSSKLVSKAQGLREHADREEVVARQSRRVVAERLTSVGTTRIVESVAGPVMTAAGVDASNTGPEGGVLVLPPTPTSPRGTCMPPSSPRTPPHRSPWSGSSCRTPRAVPGGRVRSTSRWAPAGSGCWTTCAAAPTPTAGRSR